MRGWPKVPPIMRLRDLLRLLNILPQPYQLQSSLHNAAWSRTVLSSVMEVKDHTDARSVLLGRHVSEVLIRSQLSRKHLLANAGGSHQYDGLG
jgi:hypothetical protein